MDSIVFIKEPEKKIRSLIKKITHSGDNELDKQLLMELKSICKGCKDELMIAVHKECIKCLHKEHSQVRVATVKLIDYLFQKAHIIRERLLNDFDIFLELTLAISQRPKVRIKLPPPKKHAALLQELTAKLINTWHSEYGCGYEKLRYTYRYLREHRLVDFSAFRVQNHEQLIKNQKLLERQEKILTRSIDNRLKELQIIKPEIENLLAQIESLLDILIASDSQYFSADDDSLNCTTSADDSLDDVQRQQQHGIANLSQNIEIEFSPYLPVQCSSDNKEVVQNLKELKRELVECKLSKLISIEKTLIKRSDQFVNILKQIIDLKTKSMNLVLKLGELKIFNDFDEGNGHNLDNVDSDSDSESDLEDVEPKEDLETYIPKSMRSDYGLEAIDPRELDNSRAITLTDLDFPGEASGSSTSQTLTRTCNVRLESGKLCPRRDKIKCPFHGRIIARDHKGTPVDEEERHKEEAESKKSSDVPDWQDPELLRDIKAATGVDLTMPTKGKTKPNNQKKLANTRTCDLTPKQRLQKRLKILNK